jgi:hypothetical protein
MRALGRLLWRGGVTVGICAVTAFCLAGFLSLVATSLLPQKQSVAEVAAHGCMPSHCHAKGGSRQVVAARAHETRQSR